MTPSSIRNRLVEVRRLLLEPGADLTRVVQELGVASEELRLLGPGANRSEMDAVKLELSRVARLARNGEAFWGGWGRLLGLEPAYTAAGVLASAPGAASIAVRG